MEQFIAWGLIVLGYLGGAIALGKYLKRRNSLPTTRRAKYARER